MKIKIFAIVVGCCMASQAAGDVYRCTEGGKTVYSDKPCASSGGGRIDLKVPSSNASRFGPGLLAPKIGSTYVVHKGLACVAVSDMELAYKISTDNDAAAVKKFVREKTASNACHQTKGDEQGTLSAYSRDLGFARIRMRGETEEYWIFITALH